MREERQPAREGERDDRGNREVEPATDDLGFGRPDFTREEWEGHPNRAPSPERAPPDEPPRPR